MTQRMEAIARVVLTGILGTGTALVIMLMWDTLRSGEAGGLNWAAAVVLGIVMAATRVPSGLRRGRREA
jgi:hypothetical protein